MRISDWSSGVCSSDLIEGRDLRDAVDQCFIVELRDRIPVDDIALPRREAFCLAFEAGALDAREPCRPLDLPLDLGLDLAKGGGDVELAVDAKARDAFEHEVETPFVERFDVDRSEEHTSELQSLMRSSYAVLCLQKKTTKSI